MTFTLAHLSDPHVGPLPTPRLRDLAGKRLTGYWNWHQSRRGIHSMDVLAAIRDDILAHRPDHVALTGDLVNIGMPAEFPLAARRLLSLGAPHDLSVVPGNHDAYVRGSLAAMEIEFGPFQRGDDDAPGFPFLRLRGGIGLIGVSSAVPTMPFLASGAVGRDQMRRLTAMLEDCRKRKVPTVVMLHHPPHRGGARFGRGLKDALEMEKVLARHGADLVLHGHNHRFSLRRIPGPEAQVPVVGVASASAVPGSPAHRAAWHLFRLRPDGGRLTIELEVRGIERAGGPVVRLDAVTIA